MSSPYVVTAEEMSKAKEYCDNLFKNKTPSEVYIVPFEDVQEAKRIVSKILRQEVVENEDKT